MNVPVLTVVVSSPMRNVLRVRITHHSGGDEPLRFALAEAHGAGVVEVDRDGGVVTRGDLQAVDRYTAYLDRQYMLGADVLVAPVFDARGEVSFYLPAGLWTDYFSGRQVDGGGWRTERHGFDTLPLYVRPGAVIPTSRRDDRPDHDYLDALVLEVFPAADGARSITVTNPEGVTATFEVTVSPRDVRARGPRTGTGGYASATPTSSPIPGTAWRSCPADRRPAFCVTEQAVDRLIGDADRAGSRVGRRRRGEPRRRPPRMGQNLTAGLCSAFTWSWKTSLRE